MAIWSCFFVASCYLILFLQDVYSLRSAVRGKGRSFSRLKGTTSHVDAEVRLRNAVITGDITTVRWCVDVDGTNINSAGSRGSTALHWAAEKGHTNILQFLLARGANVEVKDDEGNTPLLTSNGHLDIAQLLLEHGAEVNVQDRLLFTPLHWAAHFGHFDVVYLLISYGADLHARTSTGQLPIDVAKAAEMKRVLKQAMMVEPMMDSRACVTSNTLQ